MPKVRIVMEAEIGDLASYWRPNTKRVLRRDVRIAYQNIWDTLRRAHLDVLVKRCDLAAEKPVTEAGKRVKEAIRKSLEDERNLCERIFNDPGGFKFEVIK